MAIKKILMVERLIHVLKGKVLIISSWAPPAIGGAQSLFTIFSNIKKENYSIITSYINIENRQKYSGDFLPCEYFFYNEKIIKRKKTQIKLLKLLRAPGDMLSVILASYRVVKREKPGLLLGISDTGPSLLLTYVIARMTRTPYALYFFDIYKGNNLPGIWRYIARVLEPILFRRAQVIIVTNEGTLFYYQKEYGNVLPIEIVHNSVMPETYDQYVTEYDPKPPYTILYTGHVYWAQEQSLRNVIEAVRNMNRKDIQLKLYIPNAPKDLIEQYKECSSILFCVASQSEMPGIQAAADILLLPLSWNTPSPQIISTASPGKLTDYLIAGRPILVHAPQYAFVSKYTKEYQAACVVDAQDEKMLKKSIERLLSDKEYATTLARNAKELFLRNHNAASNAKKMAEILNKALHNSL